LGSVTRNGDLELEAQKQFGMLMKEHQTLVGINTKTKGFKLGA
jgi:hypothetical protein